MGNTFASILEAFVEYREREYREDAERDAVRLEAIESTLQALLEKLRDLHDPH